MNNDLSDFVTASCPQTSHNLLFLVDTQADISIIKKSALNKNTRFNQTNKITMKGITSKRQKSLGSTKLNLILEQELHIVDNDFPLPCHGILGKDFVKTTKSIIDYGNMTITLTNPNSNETVEIDIRTEVCDGRSILPLRSETFKMFHINTTKFPCVIETLEIERGVLIPTTVVYERNSLIRVLNVTEDYEVIKTHLKPHKLEEYDIFMCKRSNV